MQEMQFQSLNREEPLVGYGNPLQYSCLENSMDRGAWWATVHGVTKIWRQLRAAHMLKPEYYPSDSCTFRFWGISSSEMPSHVNVVKSSLCSGFLKDGLSILWFFVLWVFVCLFSSCRNLKITLLVSFLFHQLPKGPFLFFPTWFLLLEAMTFKD